jgi:hypothetical protein
MHRWLSRSHLSRALRPLALGAAVGVLVALVPGAAQAAPYCGQVWGSLPETRSVWTSGPVDDVRAGRHACFDRLVVDVGGDPAGYDVRYVPVVHRDGSGTAVPVRGEADLQLVVRAPAYDAAGRATWAPARPSEAVDVRGFTTFRQVADAGSFEGQTTIALGVRARLPFRVLVLDGPGDASRVVVDVAHRW